MNILFITATRVGDAVLSTGLLSHVIKTYPDAQITIACGPAAAGIFQAMPCLKRLIILDKMILSLHWVRMWALCLPKLWNLVVDLRNSPLSYCLASNCQKHLGRFGAERHRVVELASVFGLQDSPPSPKMWPSPKHREQAKKLIPDTGTVLAIGPTANWRAKTWAPEKFGQLVERISAKNGLLPGCRVALFGREDERPKVIQLLNSIPGKRRLDFVGYLSLIEIYACLERCQLYVGNDSGLMHIAAASGIPTLGLFGPSKENLYAPWGKNCSTIRTPESFDNIHPNGFNHRSSDSLMGSLTVEMVETAARALLEKVQRESS